MSKSLNSNAQSLHWSIFKKSRHLVPSLLRCEEKYIVMRGELDATLILTLVLVSLLLIIVIALFLWLYRRRQPHSSWQQLSSCLQQQLSCDPRQHNSSFGGMQKRPDSCDRQQQTRACEDAEMDSWRTQQQQLPPPSERHLGSCEQQQLGSCEQQQLLGNDDMSGRGSSPTAHFEVINLYFFAELHTFTV
jgi:hypothetical protein